MTFYRYIFFRIYRLFENLKSTNAHNIASGLLTIPLGLLVYKIHFLFSKFLLDQSLNFDEIVIPYLIVFLVIYSINYFLLQRGSKYLETEDFFRYKKQPKFYDFILVGLVACMIAVFVI